MEQEQAYLTTDNSNKIFFNDIERDFIIHIFNKYSPDILICGNDNRNNDNRNLRFSFIKTKPILTQLKKIKNISLTEKGIELKNICIKKLS